MSIIPSVKRTDPLPYIVTTTDERTIVQTVKLPKNWKSYKSNTRFRNTKTGETISLKNVPDTHEHFRKILLGRLTALKRPNGEPYFSGSLSPERAEQKCYKAWKKAFDDDMMSGALFKEFPGVRTGEKLMTRWIRKQLQQWYNKQCYPNCNSESQPTESASTSDDLTGTVPTGSDPNSSTLDHDYDADDEAAPRPPAAPPIAESSQPVAAALRGLKDLVKRQTPAIKERFKTSIDGISLDDASSVITPVEKRSTEAFAKLAKIRSSVTRVKTPLRRRLAHSHAPDALIFMVSMILVLAFCYVFLRRTKSKETTQSSSKKETAPTSHAEV